jgi:hypothetical protein
MVEKDSGRNRAQGWAHAKKTGHQNEQDFGSQLLEDDGLVKILETKKFSHESDVKPKISVDGTKKVASIFGDKTTSKIDLEIAWSEERSIGVSIKKSAGGQVWLVSLDRFISCLEHYTGARPPSNALLALQLFIGGPNIEKHQEKFQRALARDLSARPKIYAQEASNQRLVATSIQDTFPGVWEELLDYLTANIQLVTSLSFARGLASSEKDWADFVVYNLAKSTEQIFPIDQLTKAAARHAEGHPISAGPRYGGSTLLLPTGFLQMHHPEGKGKNLMQFHHDYKKIVGLVNP